MTQQKLIISSSLAELIHRNAPQNICLRVLQKIIQRQDYSLDTPLLHPRPIGNYFTFRERKGLISYMPKGKEQHLTAEGKWMLSDGHGNTRAAIKPGTWIKSLLSPKAIARLKIKDHDFSLIASAVKLEELRYNLSFRFVPFSEGYDSRRYATDFDSCMWGCEVGPFYRHFGAKCLVCVDGNGSFRGRAVFWPEVQMKDQIIQLLDRVYYDSEEVKLGLLEYARAEGWHHKSRQNRDSKDMITTPDGACLQRSLFVAADTRPSEDFYPYLDTFTGGTGNRLENNEDSTHDYLYHETGGGRETPEGDSVVDVDGNPIDPDDATQVNGEYYPDDDERVVYSDVCGRNLLRDDASYVADDWYPDGDRRIVWSEPESEMLLRRDAVEVEGYWYPEDSDDIVFSNPENQHLLAEKSVKIEGEYYSEESELLVMGASGTRLLKKDAIEIDGEWYAKDECRLVDGEYVPLSVPLFGPWPKEQEPLGLQIGQVVVDWRAS